MKNKALELANAQYPLVAPAGGWKSHSDQAYKETIIEMKRNAFSLGYNVCDANSFDFWIKSFTDFSQAVFCEATAEHSMLKLQDELKELASAETAANKLEEFVDCIMCLLDSAVKSGYSVEQIKDAFAFKTNLNASREWRKNPDNTYSHVKKTE